MTIFEIEAEIRNLIDEETGEVTDLEAIEKLEMAADQKRRNIICYYKNEASEAMAIRELEKELADRRHKHEKKMDSLLNLLDYIQQGQKFECTEGVVKYTKSKSVEQTDEMAFLQFKDRFLYGTTEFKADKNAIKAAIKDGTEIPGWAVTEKNNISIK